VAFVQLLNQNTLLFSHSASRGNKFGSGMQAKTIDAINAERKRIQTGGKSERQLRTMIKQRKGQQ